MTKENFLIFRAVNEIFRYYKKLTKETLIKKISTRILGFEFKSDNILKSEVTEFLAKNVLPDYK